MNMQRLAAGSLVLAGMLPLSADAAPSVYFSAPGNHDTLSGNLYQSSRCEVRGSNIARVRFWLNGNGLNTEQNAPWQCNLDTRRFPDGNYTLYATAWDSSGRAASTGVPVAIRNGTVSSGPSVSWRAPSEGAMLSGTVESGSACEVAGSNVSRVVFYLDGTQLNTEGSAPWNCYFDTRKFADGAHTLKAVAYSSSGASASATRSVSIKNATTTGTAPTVSFKTPTANATLSGALSGSACEVATSNIVRTRFWLNGTGLNNDDASPFQCSLDTRSFKDGSYTLYVTGWDASGKSVSTGVPVTVRNSSSSSGPTVSWRAPSEGATLSGTVEAGSACEVAGSGISRVQFYLDGTALNSEGGAPWNCYFDTRRFSDGTHTLKAVAYGSSGASTAVTRSVSIRNGSAGDGPTVSFKTPASGATLSGSISQSSACEVVGSNIHQVVFYIDGKQLNTELSAPWNCNVDTRRYADGSHQLMAVASNSAGAKATTQIAVNIDNDGSGADDPPPSDAAVDPNDVMGSARAEVPFSQQNGYTAQVVGTYTSAPSIPDSGIHYNTLPNGETLRFGKQTDPTNSGRKALAFQLAYSDPTTSGSRRTEISYPQRIELNKVYWVAFSMYVRDWGQLSTSDVATVGMQVHGAGSGLSPAIQLASRGGRTFWIDARTSSSNPAKASTSFSTKSPEFPLPIDRWADIVIKFKLDPSGNGFVQAWMDGTQIWNFKGKVGYYIGDLKNYMKFGYYNWTSFSNPRKVLMRGNVYLQDPTGSKYQAEEIRDYIRTHG